MKLITAIRQANEIRVVVYLGKGTIGNPKISQAKAIELISGWDQDQDFEGNRQWVDEYDHPIAYLDDHNTLFIGS